MTTATPLPTWLTRVGVFDLETTGVDVTQDRIVTAHVGVLDRHGREIAARDWLADPGIPIPDGAAAVHGVSTEHARAHGRPAREVVAEVSEALAMLFSQSMPIVAYNASYDFSLLAHEARRHGLPELAAPQPVIDPLVIDKAHDRYRRGKRTLSVVAEHYAVPLDAAHEAAADAIAAGRVALALAKEFPLPESAFELHTQQIGWARDQAASLTEYFIKVGRLEPDEALDGSWPVRSS
ncbi:exonuclease domain-containing protein [Microbacterium sp. H1-D42]|uniref:exonuclease domain-containing protein n=1 Tax=Microbacterium sp. H1-D42 TaxID=2925844 RepID=UPI001F53C11E|nr:exonuclease domain-containing protein [Microbacterium sp. H1-D42]UNK72325.1 3'-5' exonuclease [Microbacterium sp. H1-D42]